MTAYETYMASEEWEARRQSHFNRWGNACRRCRRQSNANHVHHLTYERLGREIDDDLMTLCGVHHQEAHAYAAEHPHLSLKIATLAYIKTPQQVPAKKNRTRKRDAKRKERKENGYYDATLSAIVIFNERQRKRLVSN